MTLKNHGFVAEPVRHFLFQGSGKRYFNICLVNILLVIVTLGLYLPWALIRARRYFYEHTELSGARFSYHATGGSVLVGWLGLMLLFIIFFSALLTKKAGLPLGMLFFFLFFIPWLITKAVRFQMLMTEINGIRFNFDVNPLRAWWVMAGCPLLSISALAGLLYFSTMLSFESYSISVIIVVAGISTLIFFLGIAIIQGVFFYQWFSMLTNNLRYGNLKFSAEISMKKCVIILLLAMLIYIACNVLGVMVFLPSVWQIAESGVALGRNMQHLERVTDGLYAQILLSYLISFIGIIVTFFFVIVKLRNYIYGQLVLEGGIRFSSTIRVGRLLFIALTNMLVCGLPLFLAWPWAKVRMARYLLENTHVQGDLETLTVEKEDVKPAKGPANMLARGLSFLPVAF